MKPTLTIDLRKERVSDRIRRAIHDQACAARTIETVILDHRDYAKLHAEVAQQCRFGAAGVNLTHFYGAELVVA